MAGKRIVIPNYMPALDINGDPVAGAKITFYENGTTTLKSIYTSAALSVAHPNPISANAAGVFASIFADEDEEFSVAITDADGNPISGLRNRDNVAPSLVYGQEAAESAADTVFTPAGTGAVARPLQTKVRETVSPEDFGGGGAGLLLALASLTSGGTLNLANGATYTVTRGDGNLLADTIPADNITIEGNGATIHGVPATGVIANDRYNQFYNIFQATGRTGLRFRNLKVTGALTMAALFECSDVRFENVADDGELAQGLTSVLTITGITQASPGVVTYTGTDPANGDYYVLSGIGGMTELNDKITRITNVNTAANTFTLTDVDANALNTSAYTAYSSGGVATLCSNWLRDKSIYLNECDDVVVNGASIKNVSFGVYAIGNQVDTQCGTIKVIGSRFEIDAASYTAFFPSAVYWLDVEDGLTQGCTFKNIYSSVLNGNTGSGQGYGVYEGDGQSRSIKSVGDHFIYESSGNRAAAGYYVSEASLCTIDSPTFEIKSGANVSALARLDAKRVDTTFVLSGINASVAASVPCYGVHVVGASTTRAPRLSLTDSIIVGGQHALRVEGLGLGSYATANNDFSAQESVAGAVYYIGAAAAPQKDITMRGDRITRSEGPNIGFAGYCVSPSVHNCQLLDANLGNGAGDLRSNVLFASTSQGCDIQGNKIGNTASGGGLAVYGVAHSIATASRIFKDITANNSFVGLDNGFQWLRFATASPTFGLSDLSAYDIVENSTLGAGGIPHWHCIYALRPALTANASSASPTINIEAGFASSITAGMPVLISKTASPENGDYADATKWHLDTVASVGTNAFDLTTGIDAGDGTYVAGTAQIVVGYFRAAAAIAA